ncbi:MAG: RHS repeat domain-containing protein [Arenimonas sp.]
MTQLTDPSGNTQYCYDRFGNMTRKQVTNNALVSTLLFSYTKAGRISSITYPSGMLVNYVRNALGQTTQVTVTQSGVTKTLVDNVDYLPFGPLKQLSFPVPAGGSAPSPLTQTRNYDADYAIQSVGGLTYSVDVLGNITNIADPGGSNGFVYDNIDRLKQVTNSTGGNVSQFTYDATGNRLTKQVGTNAAVTNTYPSTSHRLTKVGSVTRTLDANGNTTQTSSTSIFTYDARNRMVDFRTGSASSKIVSQYQYNGKGERVRKYKGTVDQSRYLFNQLGQLLVQNRIVSGVTTTQEIIWLDDMSIGISQNGNLHAVLTDHLNTPRQVFELATQKKVWAWSSVDDAFGENLAMEDPDANGVKFVLDMRFAGQLFDSESGLHYNYFRDYEAANGRYVESDPMGLKGGLSTYGYANQNPLYFNDPLGLWCIPLPDETSGWETKKRERNKNFGGVTINISGKAFARCTYDNFWHVFQERTSKKRWVCYECLYGIGHCGGKTEDCRFVIKKDMFSKTEKRDLYESPTEFGSVHSQNGRDCGSCSNPFGGSPLIQCEGDVNGGDSVYSNPRRPFN